MDVKQLVRVEQIRMLYAGLPTSLTVSLVNGVVLAAVQSIVIDSVYALSWLGCLVAVTIARFLLGRLFARKARLSQDAERWLILFGAGVLASGAVWGSAAGFLYPPQSMAHQVFLGFVLGGMVAGAVSLLTPIFRIYAAFVLCTLAPVVIRFSWSGDYMHYAMSGMGALYLVVMLATGRRVHDTIVQSLSLRFENRELVMELTNAHRRLEAANADLVATQQTLRASNEQLERRVAERTAALERADRHKDNFLAMLSHELRNPLAAISTSSYLLRRAGVPQAQASVALQVIDRQANYLARLVDDLLDVTQIARGKIVIRRERIDLAACVRRTAEDHEAMYRELGVRLCVDMGDGPLWTSADPTRIAQLIGNLLQNAAKFTPGGGEVTLSLRRFGEWAEIRVADTGVGIDPAILPLLFAPFVQGDRTGTRPQRGLGLGLALVKQIAELHMGSVRGESDGLDRGATFTVRLPLVSSKSDMDTESSGTGDAPSTRTRSVLIVDDNRDAADSLALLVQAYGHSTQVAYDGASAMELAQRNPPDVVLCDLGMPGMTGYELARRLRSQHKDVRLVAVSGYSRRHDATEATEAGFDGYVTKPPEPDALRAWLS